MTGSRKRMAALEAIARVRDARRDDDVVITTMASARDWMALGSHPLDLVFVPSSMGQATSIGLGLALAQPRRRVIVLNGDGSMLMNLGSLVTISAAGPANLTVIVLDNGTYEVTGAQPTPGAPEGRTGSDAVDFATIARGCGFRSAVRFDDGDAWRRAAADVLQGVGPTCVVLDVEPVPDGPGPRSPGPAGDRARRFMSALELPEPQDLLTLVDHLVLATPDVDRTVDSLEQLLGVRGSPGGQHHGEGTRNMLIALGPTSYLEIIGPDAEQPSPGRPRWFGIDTLETPRLVAWAVRDADPERRVAEAAAAGFSLGKVESGSRRLADGGIVGWRSTNPHTLAGAGVIPFYIDWGASVHPAGAATQGARLIGLRAEHPTPVQVQRLLSQLGIGLAVEPGSSPALIATLETPMGRIELR